jgi:hypothetical protein
MSFVQFIISQDIVATRPGCVVNYNNRFIVDLILNSMLERTLKIGQYLSKIWAQVWGFLFDSQCITYYKNQ